MTQTEALKLALEALTHLQPSALTSFYTIGDRDKAITAIKTALALSESSTKCEETSHAQPEQDWRNAAIRVGEDLSSVGPDGYYDMTAQQWLDWAIAQQPRGKNSLPQPEQEPVAWADECRIELVNAIHFLASDYENALGVFRDDAEARRKAEGDIAHARKTASRWNWNGTTPPQRKPLSDEQVREIAKQYALGLAFPYDGKTTPEMFARALEAAHGIKGEA